MDENTHVLAQARERSPFEVVYQGDLNRPMKEQVAAPWCDVLLATAGNHPLLAAAFGSHDDDESGVSRAKFMGVTRTTVIDGEATVLPDRQGSARVRAWALGTARHWEMAGFHGLTEGAGDRGKGRPRDVDLAIKFDGTDVHFRTYRPSSATSPLFTWNEIETILRVLAREE